MTTRSLILLLLVALLPACSNDPISPENPGNTTNGFEITDLMEDSVYYGEAVWLEFEQGGNSIEYFSLFLKTVPIPLDSLIGNKLYFHVPEGAETAQLRLYLYDSLQAKGDVELVIFEKRREYYQTYVSNAWPIEGYAGELMTITGYDFPPRKRDFAIMLGNNPCEVISHNETSMQVRVPPGSGSVAMEMRSFERMIPFGTFTYYTTEEVFLDDDQVTTFGLSASGILGKFKTVDLNNENPVSTSDTSLLWGYADLMTTTSFQRIGDSVIVSAFRGDDEDAVLQMRLRIDEENNTASGSITFYHIANQGTEEERETRLGLVISNLRWKRAFNGIEMYAHGPDIAASIVQVEYTFSSSIDKWSTELLEYSGSISEGVFSITVE